MRLNSIATSMVVVSLWVAHPAYSQVAVGAASSVLSPPAVDAALTCTGVKRRAGCP